MSERREDLLIHFAHVRGYAAWLLAGLLWLWLGMVWMPAGPSLNPGHAYNLLVALLLYVPVLIWLVRGFRAWPRYLRQSSTLRLSLLLMGWALLSLCWSNVDHRGQEAGRILSVLSLIVAWLVCFGRHRERTIEFLDIGAAALALSALMLIGMAWSAGHGLERLTAIGVLGNANSAGAVMGAACLWLMGGGSRASRRDAWRWLAVAILWVFVLLSQSRSTLAGWLAVAMLTGLTYYRHRLTPRRFALLGGLLVTGAVLVYLLGQRGMSLRPQIAARTLQMIAAGSWHGQGQGSRFLVYAGRQTLTHTHNLFTQTLLQLGWPGLLLLVALLLSALRTGLRWRHQPEGRMLLQTGLYGLVVTQFDLPVLLDSPHPVWILLWLPLAQAVLLEDEAIPAAASSRRLAAACLLAGKPASSADR